MANLLRIGRKWYERTQAPLVDLVFEGMRITQVNPVELPKSLYDFLESNQFDCSPHQGDFPESLCREWEQVESQYDKLALTLEEANRGFRRGDDPEIDLPIVVDNRTLFSLYELEFMKETVTSVAE